MYEFQAGKRFNRCHRLHRHMVTSLRILYFNSFTEMLGPASGIHKKAATLESWLMLKSLMLSEIEEFDAFSYPWKLWKVLWKYKWWRPWSNNWHPDDMNWRHPTTKLIDRTYRIHDHNLFMYALEHRCPVFFVVQRPKCTLRMVRYVLNVSVMNDTHKRIRAMTDDGAVSLRRLAKTFLHTTVN